MKYAPVTETDLHAYVDGLLPATRCAEVAAYLHDNPAEQLRVEAYRSQNAALHSLFDAVLDEPVPARLMLLAENGKRKPAWGWQQLAAGFAIAFISGGMGWFLHGDSNVQGLAQQGRGMPRMQNANGLAHQAAIAHAVYSPDVKRPVEIGAEQEAQLVTWLTKRIGTPVHPPKLAKLGYELIGGRLLPGDSGPVAQFMYQDSTGQRLTLYVSGDQVQNKDTGFQFSQQGAVNVFYWIDGKFGYALSGSISKSDLANIATAVYEQLDKPS
ncbi:anti-sigma factor family protein [Undibacterium sp. TJN19]|uniref:anti-sigma factor family protein n=1 Tax=Undibacterium sp. TJN19 TaxID=3413055 RepID=UPI003BF338C2